jgi:hypothetical protein
MGPDAGADTCGVFVDTAVDAATHGSSRRPWSFVHPGQTGRLDFGLECRGRPAILARTRLSHRLSNTLPLWIRTAS